MKVKLIEELDSNGKELTPEQEKFFNRSEVRDASGRLLVCYRNTLNKNREGFDGKIKWFTSNKEYADKYNVSGNNITYSCYLNCSKIFDCGNTDGRLFKLNPAKLSLSDDFIKILSKLNLTEQLFVTKFKNEISSPEAYMMKIFSIVRTDKFADIVKRSGYDCIKTKEEGNNDCFGVFKNEDIKLTSNKNPTRKNNISEKLKENLRMSNKVVWSSNGTAQHLASLDPDSLRAELVDYGYDEERLSQLTGEELCNLLDEEDHFWEMDSEEFDQDIVPMINKQTCNGIILMVGKAARWDGEREAGTAVFTEQLKGGDIDPDVEEVEIVDDGEGLVWLGHHHDATHVFRLYALPKENQVEFIKNCMEDAISDEYYSYSDDEDFGDVEDVIFEYILSQFTDLSYLNDYINFSQVPNYCKPIKNLSMNESLNEATPFTISKDMLNNPSNIDIGKMAKDADAKAKELEKINAAIEKGEELYNSIINDPSWAGSDSEEKLDIMFNHLVPSSGKCDTVAGEMVRAMVRLIYRDYNDGDKFYEGYGLETCASAAAFLAEKNEDLYSMIEDILDEANNFTYDDYGDEYTEDLQNMASFLVQFLIETPELFGTENEEDMLKTDSSWIEDMAPKYEFEPSVRNETLGMLIDREVVSWDDVDEFLNNLVKDNLYSGEVERHAADWYVISNLDIDDYNALEQNYYRWFESWVDDLVEEHGDPYDDSLWYDEEDEEDVDESLNEESGDKNNLVNKIEDNLTNEGFVKVQNVSRYKRRSFGGEDVYGREGNVIEFLTNSQMGYAYCNLNFDTNTFTYIDNWEGEDKIKEVFTDIKDLGYLISERSFYNYNIIPSSVDESLNKEFDPDDISSISKEFDLGLEV